MLNLGKLVENNQSNQSTKIIFKPFTDDDIPLWLKWVQKSHVKDVWFLEGYMTSEEILATAKKEAFNHPYIIVINNVSVGYILACDLHAYSTQTKNPKGLFLNEPPGTFCMDLFIGEEDYLGKGYGTQIVRDFTALLFNERGVTKILIDPATTNKRAIRCYEKAGFTSVGTEHDGITDTLVMQKTK